MAPPYGPQSVSLTQAGGDLDLLEALRGGRSRAKTQQEMLREQSMSPVEIGSYNGIQGKFPISQGLNKIAQGLLATYMDYQARDRAQAAADAQKDEAQKYAAGFAGTPAVAGVDAVLPERGTVAGPVVDGVDPETPEAANFRIVMNQLRRNQSGQEGVDYRATAPVPGMPGQRWEAAPGHGDTDDPGVVGRDAVAAQPGTGLTPAQRTARLMQGYASTNPTVNRMAAFLGTQDAEGRARQEKLDAAAQLQRDRLDARGFQARQQRELMQPARDETQRLIALDKQHRGDAVAFAAAYKAASPEDQSKMLIDAQFSGNPYLTKGATHIGDQILKGEIAKTSATQKEQDVSAAILNQYTDQLGIYKTTARTINQIDQNLARIDSGVLQFGLLNRAEDTMRNRTGFTNDQSRAKAEYENDVKRLANDVTQAAKGTQTEFDAKRAYDLIVGNLNDPDIVRTQLRNLRQIAADSQNTAATSVNIAVKRNPGLGQEPLPMAKQLLGLAPKPDPAPGAPGTQGNPTSVKTIDEALKLPPGTWITRPDGKIGQVPPR